MPAFLWEQGKHRISVSTEDISNDMMVFTMFAETKRFLFLSGLMLVLSLSLLLVSTIKKCKYLWEQRNLGMI